MPKTQREFTHFSSIEPDSSPDLKTYTLPYDPDTVYQTVLLKHAPGSTWGAPGCIHAYWEEGFILDGRTI